MLEEEVVKEVELRSEEFEEILGDVPSWILRWGITIITITIAIILIGSAIFKYPDIISSTITLTGTTPTAGIVAKTSGKLQELYVKDNQCVKKGQYLAIIENPTKSEDILYLKHYLLSISGNFDSIASLPPKGMNLGGFQSLYSSFYITLFDYIEFKRLNYYSKKINMMKERINKYKIHYNSFFRQKRIVEKQLGITKNQCIRDSILNKKNILSHEDFEKTQIQYFQGCLSLENMYSSIEDMEIQIMQMKENQLDIENQNIEKKNSLETQLKTYITQLLTEIHTWEMNYVLVAPINGKITFTNFWVENQNVTIGAEVFNIVPTNNGDLIGKALLPIARSGKVKVGQKVNIRFNNFPDNEFGVVKGIVQNISLVPSKDNDANNYIVEIKLPRGLMTTYNKGLPFLPKMEGQADIITADISLLERFFMPIKKIWNESL